MILQLDIERLRTLDEVRDFMAGSAPVDFRFMERADAYGFVRRFLVRSRYIRLSRFEKGLMRRFLMKVTGFSRAQVARLISQYRETGRIEDRRRGPKRPFASVVRRYLGHDHIPRHHAALVNGFLRDVLAPFLNYHRPCHFPVETTDAKGRVRKTYPFDRVTTPYLKLKSLDGAAQYLRPGITFEQLDQEATALDELAAARTVNEALVALFTEIRRRDATVA